MEAIFSSKLYRTSKRKDKIASAMQNPINLELVKQLEEYLDDSYKEQAVHHPLDTSEIPDTSEIQDVEKEISDVASESSSGRRPATPLRFSPSPTPVPEEVTHEDSVKEVTHDSSDSESVKEEVKLTDEAGSESSPERDAQSTFHAPKKRSDDESVEESVSINAATALYQPSVEASCCDKIRVDAAAIKGTLNVRDDTKGVSRIFVKDNELWIYYQDKINLNSVMEPVIEVLNGTGFTNLEFNRLARSDNAVVFEISCIYDDVKPMSEVDNEK